MKLNGHYFNEDRAGEGFVCFQVGNQVFGNFYTYDGLDPTWYEFTCNIVGDTAEGRVTRYSGGSMGSPQNPQKVVGEDVGSITFVHDDGWSVDAYIDSTSIEYPLTNLIPEPPKPAPITVRTKAYRNPNFFDVPAPVETAAQIFWRDLSEISDVLQVEITANEDIQFTSVGAHGYGHPMWVNVPNSMEAGEVRVVKCRLSKEQKPQGSSDAHFQLDTNHGTLIRFTAHIMQGG